MQVRGNITPMMRQYLEIKSKYKDAILLFRLGDFYETFFDDAKIVSKVLQIVLTQRNGNPMAGIPHHALDTYLRKLLDAGYKVAICEQVEDPALAKGIVKREVTKVLTPGTVIADGIIDESNRFSLLIYPSKKEYVLIIFDFSTGEVYIDTMQTSEEELIDFIFTHNFVQLLIPEDEEELYWKIKERYNEIYIEKIADWYFSKNAEEDLKRYYKVESLDFMELSDKEKIALGAVIKYLEITQKTEEFFLDYPKRFRSSDRMYLDPSTLANLQVIPNQETKGKTLYDILKFTKTPMGNRKLRDFLTRPLINEEEIRKRLNIVELFFNDRLTSEELKEYLAEIKDLDRIVTRLANNSATPKDLSAIVQTLRVIPYINSVLSIMGLETLEELGDLLDRIESTIVDEPSLQVGDGKVIREGVDKELDEYRKLLTKIDFVLKDIESRERKKTGILNLKVGRNKVYGFYIEVTKTHSNRVPKEYIRKQTLVNSERYTTFELQQLEEKINVAQEMISKKEREIYDNLVEDVKKYIGELKILSDKIAYLDVLRGFAEAAAKYNYKRPNFTSGILRIRNGRHPVVERFVEEFTPNDVEMNEGNRFIILTGPNMSGKSTYLRQIGLIAIMAQAGSFVPAEEAYLPVFDRIFTRIGARDDVVGGKSTFLVEMSEVATILNNSTEKSLILLDEVGRGTGTLDGISVAWAVTEYIYQVVKAFTIFATHYMELTLLSDFYEGIKNKRVKVMETESSIIFLHKIEDGVSDRSYGIDVARLAGLPDEVVQRAKEVLKQVEDKSELEKRLKKMKGIKRKKFEVNERQLKMF